MAAIVVFVMFVLAGHKVTTQWGHNVTVLLCARICITIIIVILNSIKSVSPAILGVSLSTTAAVFE